MTISEAINHYKENMKEADALTDALFTKEDKDEWIKALEVRAERLSKLYEEDNKLIDFIFNEIDKLEPENMDLVYDALFSLYNEGHDDSFVLIPI
ncbi:MAG: hypothetical protein K6B64_01210 [Acholeplasmatales bacterium]|nr:hypothetical protein [Acholeplasmatales bacterium]